MALPNLLEEMRNDAKEFDKRPVGGWKFVLQRIPINETHKAIARRLVRTITNTTFSQKVSTTVTAKSVLRLPATSGALSSDSSKVMSLPPLSPPPSFLSAGVGSGLSQTFEGGLSMSSKSVGLSVSPSLGRSISVKGKHPPSLSPMSVGTTPLSHSPAPHSSPYPLSSPQGVPTSSSRVGMSANPSSSLSRTQFNDPSLDLSHSFAQLALSSDRDSHAGSDKGSGKGRDSDKGKDKDRDKDSQDALRSSIIRTLHEDPPLIYDHLPSKILSPAEMETLRFQKASQWAITQSHLLSEKTTTLMFNDDGTPMTTAQRLQSISAAVAAAGACCVLRVTAHCSPHSPSFYHPSFYLLSPLARSPCLFSPMSTFTSAPPSARYFLVFTCFSPCLFAAAAAAVAVCFSLCTLMC